MAWCEALTHDRSWDQGRDTPRIRHGFAALARTALRWPAPAELVAALAQPDAQPRIERPTVIAKDRAKRTQHLAQVLGPDFNPAAAAATSEDETRRLHRLARERELIEGAQS